MGVIFYFLGPNELFSGLGSDSETALGLLIKTNNFVFRVLLYSALSCSFEFLLVVDGSQPNYTFWLFCCWGCGCCRAVIKKSVFIFHSEAYRLSYGHFLDFRKIGKWAKNIRKEIEPNALVIFRSIYLLPPNQI